MARKLFCCLLLVALAVAPLVSALTLSTPLVLQWSSLGGLSSSDFDDLYLTDDGTNTGTEVAGFSGVAAPDGKVAVEGEFWHYAFDCPAGAGPYDTMRDCMGVSTDGYFRLQWSDHGGSDADLTWDDSTAPFGSGFADDGTFVLSFQVPALATGGTGTVALLVDVDSSSGSPEAVEHGTSVAIVIDVDGTPSAPSACTNGNDAGEGTSDAPTMNVYAFAGSLYFDVAIANADGRTVPTTGAGLAENSQTAGATLAQAQAFCWRDETHAVYTTDFATLAAETTTTAVTGVWSGGPSEVTAYSAYVGTLTVEYDEAWELTRPGGNVVSGTRDVTEVLSFQIYVPTTLEYETDGDFTIAQGAEISVAISLQSVVYETVTPGDGSDMIDGTAQIKISTYFNEPYMIQAGSVVYHATAPTPHSDIAPTGTPDLAAVGEYNGGSFTLNSNVITGNYDILLQEGGSGICELDGNYQFTYKIDCDTADLGGGSCPLTPADKDVEYHFLVTVDTSLACPLETITSPISFDFETFFEDTASPGTCSSTQSSAFVENANICFKATASNAGFTVQAVNLVDVEVSGGSQSVTTDLSAPGDATTDEEVIPISEFGSDITVPTDGSTSVTFVGTIDVTYATSRRRSLLDVEILEANAMILSTGFVGGNGGNGGNGDGNADAGPAEAAVTVVQAPGTAVAMILGGFGMLAVLVIFAGAVYATTHQSKTNRAVAEEETRIEYSYAASVAALSGNGPSKAGESAGVARVSAPQLVSSRPAGSPVASSVASSSYYYYDDYDDETQGGQSGDHSSSASSSSYYYYYGSTTEGGL